MKKFIRKIFSCFKREKKVRQGIIEDKRLQKQLKKSVKKQKKEKK